MYQTYQCLLSRKLSLLFFKQQLLKKICFAQWYSATISTCSIPTKQLSTRINDETTKMSKTHPVSPFLALGFFLGAFCWCEVCVRSSRTPSRRQQSHGEVWRMRRDLCCSAQLTEENCCNKNLLRMVFILSREEEWRPHTPLSRSHTHTHTLASTLKPHG